LSTAAFAFTATSASSPDAMQRAPLNAVQWFWASASMANVLATKRNYIRVEIENQYYPDKIWGGSRGRVKIRHRRRPALFLDDKDGSPYKVSQRNEEKGGAVSNLITQGLVIVGRHTAEGG
jgi:hypothetical protein